MKTACLLLADGFEEVEALLPVDYLRRAGIDVVTAGVTAAAVKGSHGIKVFADIANLSEIDRSREFDAIIVPGGMPGASHIAASSSARALILRHYHAGKLIAAICAAPAVVLHGGCGILKGRKFTGYPGTEGKVEEGIFTAGRVVEDGNIITARAAGCAAEFSFAIIRRLEGEAAVSKLAGAVLER